jgi:hypothetical protein
MRIHAFRPATRWVITVTVLTALACGGTLPAYASPADIPVSCPSNWVNISSMSASSYGSECATFETYQSLLYVSGSFANGNTGLGIADTPAIAALPGGGFEVAFQATGGDLWVYGTDGTDNTNLGMAAGTSPAITGLPGGGFEVASRLIPAICGWREPTEPTTPAMAWGAPPPSPPVHRADSRRPSSWPAIAHCGIPDPARLNPSAQPGTAALRPSAKPTAPSTTPRRFRRRVTPGRVPRR